MGAPNSAHWQGRRVLVTGSTGFKGSWLCLWLRELGAHVRGYALAPPTTPSLFEAIGIGRQIEQTIGDVRDAEALRRCVDEFAPDTIFHLAAQPLVRDAYRDPVSTFATNVLGTVHVLDAARNAQTSSAIVVVTSDKVYENREWHWGYRESDALGGHDPYSVSKACTELVASAYRRSYFSGPESKLGLATARAGNVVGGGDFGHERLVPDAMRAFAKGEQLCVRKPQAIRPWQHVLEPVLGYIKLAEQLTNEPRAFAEAWNFGPQASEAVRVSELATLLSQAWGNNAQWFCDAPQADTLHETTRLEVDSSKTRARLGVRSRLNVAETLQWTVAWYKQHAAGADEARLRELCRSQIAEYATRLVNL